MKLIKRFELASRSKNELRRLLQDMFNELARAEPNTAQRRNVLASLEVIRAELAGLSELLKPCVHKKMRRIEAGWARRPARTRRISYRHSLRSTGSIASKTTHRSQGGRHCGDDRRLAAGAYGNRLRRE